MEVIVYVPGRPCQEGNMTAVKGHVFHANDSKLKTYRSLVGNAMFNEMKKHGMHITDNAVSIDVTFWFSRPKSHFTTKGKLSSCYQSRHTTRPDTDKLIRAVLDALTGIAYRDDSQVDFITARKTYGTEPHTTIKISFCNEVID